MVASSVWSIKCALPPNQRLGIKGVAELLLISSGGLQIVAVQWFTPDFVCYPKLKGNVVANTPANPS
jgi:hypothetical protein